MEKQEFKTVIAPKGCRKYFTEGKEYEVIGFWIKGFDEYYGYMFNIIDDMGFKCDCLEKHCAHLNGGNWIIKETI